MGFGPAQGSGGSNFGSEIDLSEQATMAADQLLGRKNGAGTGVPQVMTLTEALTLGGTAPTGTGAVVRATSPTLVTPALGTPASGTLTNCTGLPQAGVVGLTTADSPQLAGVNLGHASDTTVTRLSAGRPGVEGVPFALGDLVYEAHTGDDTLTTGEAGSVHSNSGASGTVTLTLPAAASGRWFIFVCAEAQTFNILCAGADTVRQAAMTGTNISNNAAGRTILLVAIGTEWNVVAQVTSWTVT